MTTVPAKDYDAEAHERAQQLRPDLDPSTGKGAARSHRALVRVLSVVAECNDLRAQGVRNATAIVAERRDLTAITVRMLLHRARTEHGLTVVDQPTVPSLEGVLRIVADWYASSEGRDVLVEELTEAGYQLPEADR